MTDRQRLQWMVIGSLAASLGLVAIGWWLWPPLAIAAWLLCVGLAGWLLWRLNQIQHEAARLKQSLEAARAEHTVEIETWEDELRPGLHSLPDRLPEGSG